MRTAFHVAVNQIGLLSYRPPGRSICTTAWYVLRPLFWIVGHLRTLLFLRIAGCSLLAAIGTTYVPLDTHFLMNLSRHELANSFRTKERP